jgi:AcrR family transcriptional regulator
MKRTDTPHLAWGNRRAPTRGPKPGLNTTQIARVAIGIADREGLEAVTMQRLAQDLGVTTMALYRYFPSKADLLAVMIDSAGDSAPDLGKPSAPWRDRLRKWAHACAHIYRKHPWFLEATTVRRSVMGPNELSWMEVALGLLTEAGLAPEECHGAFLAIIGHVRGYATFEQIKSHGESPRQWIRELDRLLRTDGRRYPVLQAVVGSGALSKDPDATFDFGLNYILDGISLSVHNRKESQHESDSGCPPIWS